MRHDTFPRAFALVVGALTFVGLLAYSAAWAGQVKHTTPPAPSVRPISCYAAITEADQQIAVITKQLHDEIWAVNAVYLHRPNVAGRLEAHVGPLPSATAYRRLRTECLETR